MSRLINCSIIGFISILIGCTSHLNYKETNNQFATYLDTITFCSIQTPELHCKGIPDSVYKMVNLKRLFIQGQDCDIFYDEGNYLHPECCFIKEISPQIKNLKKLEELNLLLNGLNSLPKEIEECQNLKIIDLTDGQITSIDVLVKLKKLEILYVFGCNLTKLPQNIGELKSLKVLGLTGNFIDKTELKRIKSALPKCEIIYDD